ncbi:MAG: transpeptidase family protein [Chitinophagales bacterium]|nr:transpeptidase family protein [Chitinophagales bacterium]
MANKKKEILLRAYLGFLFICLLGMAIIGRAFYIQTTQGEYYRSLADSLTIYPKKILAERGNIYSEDGRLLATTLPTFDIRIDFKTIDNAPKLFNETVDSVSMLLSLMFNDKSKQQYKTELLRERKKKSRYYLLKRNVSYNQLNEMKRWPLFRAGQYVSGMIAVQNDKRMMPFGLLAQRTIGFTNKSGSKVGLEGKFDEQLKGVQGQVMVQKISGGAIIPIDSKEQITPQPGKDIYTTLNVELQDVAQAALYRALEHHRAEHGCVVLMEVKTGKIKAIANLGMNPDSSYSEKFNYAAGEATEPGSTFKLATVAALMEDGRINNNTAVEVGDGVAKFYSLTIKDHDRPETPSLTVKRAIEVSSNVAVAKLAYDNYSSSPAKFYRHLEDFGFTQKINIELPGAATPVLAQPKKWSGVSTAFIAHGYELQVTPLHTLMFYNAIANNGVMVQPRMVEKVKEYNNTVDSFSTVVLNEKLLSEATIRQLREMLVGVVENGTARNLKTDYLQVAGKTGTAVIAQGKDGYKNAGKKIYQASFCGYFPADAPQYSMIVVINSPSTNGYYGNVVAGTIFKEVADKVYSLNLNMHPSVNVQLAAENKLPVIQKGNTSDIKNIYAFLGTKMNEIHSEWATVTANGNRLLLAENEMNSDVMPDVTGMSLKDAIYLLESMGVKVFVSGKGNIKTQSINAGEKISRGMQVTLELN